MNENGSFPHIPDEEVVQQYLRTREHVDLPEELPDDIRDAIENDPNPQTLQWVIDESHGDLPLLRLLLTRDRLTQGFLDRTQDPRALKEALAPITASVRKRKEELGLDNNYRF